MKREDSTKTALTKKDISDTLNEFFGKQIEPRFDNIDKKLEEHDKKFNDLSSHFDQIYNRLDRLETEYFTIIVLLVYRGLKNNWLALKRNWIRKLPLGNA